MQMVDAQCRVCGHRAEALQREKGGIAPCSEKGCGGERERIYTDNPVRTAVHTDDIPGGVWIKHGICNEDGTPKRYDTRHAIREATRKAGLLSLEEAGQQVPVTDAETERNLCRKGYENTPRVVVISGVLNPEDEAARVAHWLETERELQQEL